MCETSASCFRSDMVFLRSFVEDCRTLLEKTTTTETSVNKVHFGFHTAAPFLKTLNIVASLLKRHYAQILFEMLQLKRCLWNRPKCSEWLFLWKLWATPTPSERLVLDFDGLPPPHPPTPAPTLLKPWNIVKTTFTRVYNCQVMPPSDFQHKHSPCKTACSHKYFIHWAFLGTFISRLKRQSSGWENLWTSQ